MYKYRNMRKTSIAKAPSLRTSCFVLRLAFHFIWRHCSCLALERMDFVNVKKINDFHEMHSNRKYNGPEISA
jgi:hypothetical protein